MLAGGSPLSFGASSLLTCGRACCRRQACGRSGRPLLRPRVRFFLPVSYRSTAVLGGASPRLVSHHARVVIPPLPFSPFLFGGSLAFSCFPTPSASLLLLVSLRLEKGLRYTSLGGSFPTIFHRIYAFDQATYYLQVTSRRCRAPLFCIMRGTTARRLR